MLKVRKTTALFGILILAPSLALALPLGQTPTPTKTPPPKTAPAAVVHATNGVVKSVDATLLVINKGSAKGAEMTFVLNASTQRKGAVAPGAKVEVRYRIENKQNVATAVSVQTSK